ncbi:hypothetical protein GCM10014719_41370 [Planomonospora parontospora subsp. antibiotica]|nr:hypothetical protein GCM10014719_41370 [Planomonospora parontospora subsp. antibiotica]GII17426.1 hypothetical protein Ppa05_41520 [Planomonospora parontospora subsp. antibiotica]
MVPTSNGEAAAKWRRGLKSGPRGKRAGPDAEGTGSAHSPHGGCLMDDDSKAFARHAGCGPDSGPGSGAVDAAVDAARARPAPSRA